MSQTLHITVFCPDRPGLVAALGSALFDLGANLGDTSFAVLGEAAEWSSICEVDDDLSIAEVENTLRALPETKGAQLSVKPFELDATHGPSARITHRIILSGGDRPGLIARLAEVFGQYDANIVRLNSERVPTATGARYQVRIAVNIPDKVADTCLATVVNTAGELGLAAAWERA